MAELTSGRPVFRIVPHMRLQAWVAACACREGQAQRAIDLEPEPGPRARYEAAVLA